MDLIVLIPGRNILMEAEQQFNLTKSNLWCFDMHHHHHQSTAATISLFPALFSWIYAAFKSWVLYQTASITCLQGFSLLERVCVATNPKKRNLIPCSIHFRGFQRLERGKSPRAEKLPASGVGELMHKPELIGNFRKELQRHVGEKLHLHVRIYSRCANNNTQKQQQTK